MTNWEKYLKQIGLNESEVRVYLSILKTGPETVQNIAKNVKLSRVTVYSAVDTLIKHGLMSSVEKGKKQFYAVEPPERIVTVAENQMRQMDSVLKDIKANVQELFLMQGGNKPVVKMYEGPEAFSVIQQEVLNTEIDMLYEIGNRDVIRAIYPIDENLRREYFDKLIKKKMMRHTIFISKDQKSRPEVINQKTKFLDPRKFKFTGDVFMYNDTVWLSNFTGKQVVVMIKNQGIKDVLQAMFDMLWNTLPDRY